MTQQVVIRIAAKTPEFNEEIEALSVFADRLNEVFAGRYSFTVLPYEQGAHNLDDCTHFYVLAEVGKDNAHLQDAFNQAWERYAETFEPALFVYARNDGEPVVNPGAFLDMIGAEFEHYWNTYVHVAELQNDILIEHVKETGSSAVTYEDGKAWIYGKPVLNLDDVRMYAGNETLQQMRKKLAELDETFAKLVATSDDAERSRISTERKELANAIRQTEADILGLGVRIAELTDSDLETWRVRKASDLLRAGNYEAAIDVLDDPLRKDELQGYLHDRRLNLAGIEAWILEQRQQIEAASQTGNMERVLNLYEEGIEVALKYRVGTEIVDEFASYLEKCGTPESLERAVSLREKASMFRG